ncbi:MAG: DUF4160 domain-containing protein [Chloroflexota bacterium]
MPRVSKFFGVLIYMYYNDHQPPHFHAEYGEHEALYVIETLETLRGSLPRRAHALVIEWATLHRAELRENWERARQQRPLSEIEGLE